jgi:hypothetical protein
MDELYPANLQDNFQFICTEGKNARKDNFERSLKQNFAQQA